MPKRRRWEKNEETEGREKGLTNFDGPTAGNPGLVGKHFPQNIKAQLAIPKPPTHNKGSASRGLFGHRTLVYKFCLRRGTRFITSVMLPSDLPQNTISLVPPGNSRSFWFALVLGIEA